MNFNEIWPAILAVASAIVLLSQAAEKIGKAIPAAAAFGFMVAAILAMGGSDNEL